MSDTILAVPLFLPLIWAAVLTAWTLFRPAPAERVVTRVALLVHGAAFAATILVLVSGHAHLQLGRWLQLDGFDASVGLTFDLIGGTYALVATGWTLIIARATAPYLHREPGLPRFYAALGVLTTGAVLIGTADSLLLVFAGWELAGLASAALIGWRTTRPDAVWSALRALLTNRPGDAGLWIALMVLVAAAGSTSFATMSGLGQVSAMIVSIGVATAAIAKSGQPPFSPWLARAMEGPTPSSALFYAAVLIHAGPVLLLRVDGALGGSTTLRAMAAVVGLAGFVAGALISLTATDIKSVLVHASMSQAGVTLILVGLGQRELALLHLVGHGAMRAWQLLSAPSYRALVRDQPVRQLNLTGPGWGRVQHALSARFWLSELHHAAIVAPLVAASRRLVAADSALDISSRVATVAHDLFGEPAQAATQTPAGRALHALLSAVEAIEDTLFTRLLGQTIPAFMTAWARWLERADAWLAEPWFVPVAIVLTVAAMLGGAS
jgi:NADH:ubiquinone oxidoreductase subunit 5 (subunit L)/multisubunit Na+/H+ antiporter MnhA subunit